MNDDTVTSAINDPPHGNGQVPAVEPPMAADCIATDEVPKELELAHDSLANAFIAANKGNLRFNTETGKWYHWTGKRWTVDKRLRILTMARKFVRDTARVEKHSLKDVRWALQASNIIAVISLARAGEGVGLEQNDLDANLDLLGTQTEVIDLPTGKVLPPDKTFLITKATSCSVAQEGVRPERWLQLLDEVFQKADPNGIMIPDLEFIAYFKRVLGSTLSGRNTEHTFYFMFGQGANGKSVILNTLLAILAEYATVIPAEMLLTSPHDRHSTEIAMLAGRRLALAHEMQPGRNLDVAKVKTLTGGDQLMGRFMRQDNFQFTPQFSLIAVGNHRPGLPTSGESLLRRLRLLNFDRIIPVEQRDPNLTEKLVAEHPAILAWMVEGCVEWMRDGMNTPQSVLVASADYVTEEDMLGQWLDSDMMIGKRWSTPAGLAFARWSTCAEANGAPPGKPNGFSKKLDERGFGRRKSNGVRLFDGLRAKTSEEQSIPSEDIDPGSHRVDAGFSNVIPVGVLPMAPAPAIDLPVDHPPHASASPMTREKAGSTLCDPVAIPKIPKAPDAVSQTGRSTLVLKPL